MTDQAEWWIDVTDADIRAARTALRQARDRGEAPERVQELRTMLELLWRIQARQIARDYQREHFTEGVN